MRIQTYNRWTRAMRAGAGTCVATLLSLALLFPLATIAQTSVTNTATITPPAGVTDPTPGNNTASDTDTVVPRPNLTKAFSPTSITDGSPSTLTFTITNAANAPAATDLGFVDTLPAGLQVVTPVTFGGTCASTGGAALSRTATTGASGVITVTGVDLAAGGAGGTSCTVTIPVTNVPGQTGTCPNAAFTNSAISGLQGGLTNGVTPQCLTVNTRADLTVTKTAPASAVVGTPFDFTLAANNIGGSATTAAITVTDTINAANLNINSITASAGWTCTPNTGFPITTGSVTVSCTNPGPIAAATSNVSVATINVTPRAGALLGPVGNTANISGGGETNTANNSSTTSTTLTAVDLTVTKTAPANASIGTPFNFTIVANNPGTADSSGTVTVTDTINAANLNINSITPGAGWTCTPNTGFPITTGSVTVTCTRSTAITAGTTNQAVATINVTPRNGALPGPATNTASISGGNDSNTGNNTSNTSTTLTPVADLQITKTSSPNPYVPGNALTYTITVTNAGPSNVTGATIADTIPASLTGVTWTCTAAGTSNCGATASGTGNSINLTTGVFTVGAGNSITLSVTGTVNPATTGNITNTATVTAPAGVTDPTPGNNSATDTNPANPTADLRIAKVGPATAPLGGAVQYTITINNDGPSSVTGAAVNDNVPAAIQNVTWSCAAVGGAGNACGTASGTGSPISLLVDVAAGAGNSVVITVNGRLAQNAGTAGIDNTATVAAPAGTTDPNPGNNSATATVTPVNTADVSVQKNGPVSAVPGNSITYTLTLNNTGPASADGTLLSDALPAQITSPSISCIALNGAVFPATPTAAQLASGVAASALPAGGRVICTITGTITGTVGSTVGNTATATPPASVDDPTPSNNTSTVTTQLVATPPPAIADLAIVKSGPSSVAPNGTVTYSIAVTNSGPGPANNAVVADTIPLTGATWSCGAAGGAVCPTATGSGNINQVIATFPAGGQLNYTVSGTAPASGTVTNTATVTPPAGTTDPDNTNNASTVNTQIAAQTAVADIVVAKTGPANIGPGGVVTYNIVVTNKGPDAANGTVITDNVPAILTGVTTTCSGAACPGSIASGNAVNVTLANFPALASVSLTVTGSCTTPACAPNTSFSNAATAQPPAGTTDPVPADNTGGPVITQVVGTPIADLTVQKNGPAVVAPGGALVYTITVSNNGPAAANNALVSDVIPAALTGITATCGDAQGGAACPASVTVAGQNVSATIPTLPSGGSVVITVDATAPSSASTFTNTATVAAPAGVTDPNPANNTSSIDTTVGIVAPTANLAVVKTGSSTVQTGGTITYSVTVTNAGPAPANGATFADTVPAAITNVTWSCVSAGGAVCPQASGSGNAISQIIATFPPNGELTYTVSGTAPATAQSLTNTATITAPAGITDPDPSNNTSSAVTQVQTTPPPQADIAVSKVGPATVAANGAVTYSIVVTNNGPAAANGTVVTDNVPVQVTGVTTSCIASNGATCPASIPAGNTLNVTIPTLPQFGQVTLTVNGTAPASGTFTNIASVTPPAGVSDPNPSNNIGGPVTTSIPAAQADLALQKNGPAVVSPSGTVTYTLTITNNGPAAADGAAFSDTVPTQVTGLSAVCGTALGGAACPPSVGIAGQTVSGTVPTLPSGGSVVITISGVGPAGAASFSNTATVTPPAGVTDPTPANNTSTVNTTVGVVPAQANLAIVKVGPSTVQTGAVINYVITVTNAGPGSANGAVFADTVPAGISNVLWTCAASGGAVCPNASGIGNTINQTIAIFPVNGELTYSVTGTAPLAAQSLSNTATITPPLGVADPDTTNNASTVPTTVTTTAPTQADLVISKVGPATVAPNGTVTYSIVVTNNGPAPADGAAVTDNVPAAVTNVSTTCVAQSGAACPASIAAGNAVSAIIPTLPPFGRVTLTVTGTAPASGSFSNTATVTTPPGVTDPDTASNTGGPVITSIPVQFADLAVQKNGPVTVTPNGAISYSITLTNAGPAAADGAVLQDALPATVVPFSIACVVQGGAVFPAAPTAAQLATGVAASTLPPGGRVVCTIAGTANAAAGTVINNTATVTPPANITDPQSANNSSTTATNVVTTPPPATADLSVVKNGPASVAPNGTVTYTITVTNAGPSAANNATVADTIPLASPSWTCAAIGGAVCPAASGTGNINAVVATFPAGGVLTYSVTGTAPASGSISNTANVTPPAGVTDPVPANNASTVATQIAPITATADLVVAKTGPATISAGDAVTYTIVVTNRGPSPAGGATISDNVPAQVSSVTTTCAASGGAVCPASIAAGNTISAVVPTFPPFGQITLTVSGTCTAPACLPGTTFSNTATAQPPVGVADPNPADNTGGPVITQVRVVPSGTVTGTTYVDTDGDGTRDAGEPPIAGVTVTLQDTLGNVVATTTTDANGNYTFSGVIPGNYVVVQTQPNTYVTSTPNSVPVTVVAGTPSTADFGERGGSFSGSVYVDSNNNNQRDAGEAGLAGVTVTLTGTDLNGVPVTRTATTDGTGNYTFTNLPAGTYSITETQPTGVNEGTAQPGSLGGTASGTNAINAITLPAGGTGTNYNFSEVTPVGTLTGSVFGDTNLSGVRDLGENGLAGITVTLTPTGGGTPIVVVTDANGVYTAQVPPGTYTVQATTPSGQTLTTANNPQSATVTNGQVTVATPIGFGAGAATGTVSGTVWRDANHNRTLDAGEQRIAGFRVELLNASGAVVATTTTNANGDYTFANVPVGSGYQIVFREPSNGVIYGTPVGQDPSGNNGTAVIDRLTNITVTPGVTIVNQNLPLDPSGVVYDSTTRQPVAGAVVTITGPAGFNPATHLLGGSAAASQTTGPLGIYEFVLVGGAPAGTYTITVTPPTGYTQSAITPSGTLTPPARTGTTTVFTVQPQPNPPAVGSPTTYHLTLNLTPGTSQDVVNNHIPLDRLGGGGTGVTQIPTLSEWAMLIMMLALGWMARRRLRQM